MALSSDEIVKRQIIDEIGYNNEPVHILIFPESSREDQKLFRDGGLTFGYNNISYGSCDAVWYIDEAWVDGYDGAELDKKPFIALEGTDALNRNSGGNALYQRFHHALGAVRNGVIGVYYLKKGSKSIQPDLYGMAYFASMIEKGDYLITDDLSLVKELIDSHDDEKKLRKVIDSHLKKMFEIFNEKFESAYKSDWNNFANKRSTVVFDDYVVKYAGRNTRNFTDGSQRAGHIAVGEMYLTKYYFYDKKFFYLFPRMTQQDLDTLDGNKKTDKEWFLLRNEPNVFIKTSSDILGLSDDLKKRLFAIKDSPLKGDEMREYNACTKDIFEGLKSGKYKIIN